MGAETKGISVELKFVQIQCVPVENVSTTQCNVFMYGLDADGKVWFKRDNDEKWVQESMLWKAR